MKQFGKDFSVQVSSVTFHKHSMLIGWKSPEFGSGTCKLLPGDGELVTIDDCNMGRDFIKALLGDIIDNCSAFYSDD